jgi:GNAT superfamily N-acetyltransferase
VTSAVAERVYELRQGAYAISTDPSRLDLDVIHGYLSRSYWAEGVPRGVVARSLEHSLNFGLYEWQRQVGFARVITDRATYGCLADVFVLESLRGRGLGIFLIDAVMAHPELQGLRRFELVTRDAHPLYEKFGFRPLGQPERHMEIVRAEAYRRQEG